MLYASRDRRISRSDASFIGLSVINEKQLRRRIDEELYEMDVAEHPEDHPEVSPVEYKILRILHGQTAYSAIPDIASSEDLLFQQIEHRPRLSSTPHSLRARDYIRQHRLTRAKERNSFFEISPAEETPEEVA